MPQGTFPKLKLQVQTKPKETLKETYRSLEQGNLGMRTVSQYAEAFKIRRERWFIQDCLWSLITDEGFFPWKIHFESNKKGKLKYLSWWFSMFVLKHIRPLRIDWRIWSLSTYLAWCLRVSRGGGLFLEPWLGGRGWVCPDLCRMVMESRFSPSWHYWHLRLDHSLSWGPSCAL